MGKVWEMMDVFEVRTGRGDVTGEVVAEICDVANLSFLEFS